jgi:hypothetical protein
MSHEFPESDYERLAAPFEDVLAVRLTRRSLLAQAGAAVAALPLVTATTSAASPSAPREFRSVRPQRTDAFIVADGYRSQVVARWGDSLFAAQSSLDPRALANLDWLNDSAAAAQARQFGVNCDAVAFFATGRDAGLLCVNHEYVVGELVFAGWAGGRSLSPKQVAERRAWILRNPRSIAWAQAAHGVSVMEVRRGRNGWRVLRDAPVTRRITANTPCDIHGPARGHRLLTTNADPEGTRALGTFANCAGGKTPWGTYLTAEENIDDYFGFGPTALRQSNDRELHTALRRAALGDDSLYGWEYVDSRFDMRREPHEPLRHGWIVEIDPRRPDLPPRKRTALGRFQHEGANTILCRDGRVAAYMGDDEKYEYVYKFVTRDRFDPQNPSANTDLLDNGVLYAARFNADGSGVWLPLVQSESGPLNAANGFATQGDVVVKARAAADLLGATPMDRPEDVEPNPTTGRVYVACTKSADRTDGSRLREFNGRRIDLAADAANPRPNNRHGHIVEIIETGDDASATTFRWNVFLLAGDPREGRYLTSVTDLKPGTLDALDTYFAGFPTAAAQSPIFCPDNLGVDPSGRLWIVTDHDEKGRPNNGCFVVPTTGPQRGRLRQLASGPVGSELCGCEFTPDGRTLFITVQHPGEGGSIEEPISDWPDGGRLPARASLVAIERKDGGPI